MITITWHSDADVITVDGHASNGAEVHTTEHVRCCNAITGACYMLAQAYEEIGAPDAYELRAGYMRADMRRLPAGDRTHWRNAFIFTMKGIAERYPNMVRVTSL